MRTAPRGVVITGGEAVQSEYRPVQLLILVLIDSLSMAEVHLTPGWQARWDDCPNWRT